MNLKILEKLKEEASEVIHAACKTTLYDLDSVSPKTGYTNQEYLEQEIGDICAVIAILIEDGTVREKEIYARQDLKFDWLKKTFC